jgi:2-(1,2-epoxy-1,2-dihydrophenyl)acetyl-CoA isomerase
MTEENILLLEKKKGVGIITLHRPDKLNAFNDELTFKLKDALKETERDHAIKVVVLTGAGRGFCSGQDLQARGLHDHGQRPSLGVSIRHRYNPIILKIRSMEKPVIAAVNGVAAGVGASLAFVCDLRFASDKAYFVQSFTKVGLIPDSGSTFFLPRLVGVTKAFELMLTAEKIEADEALRLGLVNKVLPQDELMDEVMSFAERLATGPSLAYGLTKRAVNRAIFPDIEELLEYEASLQEIAGRSDDFEEGVKAFIEKREPVYKGR